MMHLNKLLNFLHYEGSPHYFDTSNRAPDTRLAHIFRAARKAGVNGIYLFRSSTDHTLPERPAVFIAEASSTLDAREIHKKLWNLGQAPFLIVLLPNEVRIYTGFDYSIEQDKAISKSIGLDDHEVTQILQDFIAESVNSGRLWRVRSNDLHTDRRVDVQLLNSLMQLGEVLKSQGLEPKVAHALIGKYIYINYLRQRKILSDEWLASNGINPNQALGRNATLAGLQRLVMALESHFNGDIFPLDFDTSSLTNSVIALVASAFQGDVVMSNATLQYHLDFDAYDFGYIPIETLSSIYEQFLHAEGRGAKVGAYYTPEPLADYLLAELNSIKPLKKGMRVFDPSCGSGIFLVLAYRQLIEREIAKRPNKKITPTELREILTESIYGVEREPDACYVAEFSLILTLLDYIEPPELHRNKQFKLPSLHNKHIFECDFFNNKSEFYKENLRFDWIVGNPPWIELRPTSVGEDFVRQWIETNRVDQPVSGYRVSEAFSWHVIDLLKPNGIAGLVLHAKSLVNDESTKYRRSFFAKHNVFRITNFSNLRYVIFAGRSTAPAYTIIYGKITKGDRPITHCGPFLLNQVPYTPTGRYNSIWTLSINENEIQWIDPIEAKSSTLR